jgi:hypothetical protein
MLEQCVTADNYLKFLTNELPLLMEDVPLETRHRTFFQHNEMPLHFGQVVAYMNHCYKNNRIGHHHPIPWMQISPELTMLDFTLWGLMKEMTYRTKVHMREELLHQIMDAAAYI